MKRQIQLEIESPVLDRMEMYAEALKIPVELVIQNLLVNQWAKEAAEHELGIPTAFLQFMKAYDKQGKGHTVTGEALFNALKSIYRHSLERELKGINFSFTDDAKMPEGLSPKQQEEWGKYMAKQKKWEQEYMKH